MTGADAFLMANPDITVFLLFAVVAIVFLIFANRSSRMRWIDTAITNAMENLTRVDTEQLTRLEYSKLRGVYTKQTEKLEEALSRHYRARNIEVPKSDVWAFEITSPGGSTITWFMRPEKNQFLSTYTMINNSRQSITPQHKRQLKELGNQAYIMHKMTHK